VTPYRYTGEDVFNGISLDDRGALRLGVFHGGFQEAERDSLFPDAPVHEKTDHRPHGTASSRGSVRSRSRALYVSRGATEHQPAGSPSLYASTPIGVHARTSPLGAATRLALVEALYSLLVMRHRMQDSNGT
jgi:hypothetical protein